jgi:hypothetical protein
MSINIAPSSSGFFIPHPPPPRWVWPLSPPPPPDKASTSPQKIIIGISIAVGASLIVVSLVRKIIIGISNAVEASLIVVSQVRRLCETWRRGQAVAGGSLPSGTNK